MADYKQLCAELVDDLELCDWPFKLKETIRADIDRARAALAEPEPKGPTDQEIEEWADACPEVPLMELDVLHGWQLCFTAQEFSETIRAAIARWGNHPGSPDRLAQPELEEPSFGDVIEWASGIEPWATWLAPGGCLENAHFEFGHLVTFAVARWGSSQGILDSSTPEPVPVSETWPEFSDCDDAERVWCFNWALNHWKLSRIKQEVHSHWLPAHALPKPS
jgi:hypothetical protein